MNFPMEFLFFTGEGNLFIYLLLNLCALVLALAFLMRCHQKTKEVISHDDTLLELDYDTSGYLICGGNSAADFIIASLLSFYAKGAIKLTLSSFTTRKGTEKANYLFYPISDEKLSDTEKCLYHILFPQGAEISSRELNRLRQDFGTDYNNTFGEYLTFMENTLQKWGLKAEKPQGKFVLWLFVSAVLVFIVALVSLSAKFYPAFFTLVFCPALLYCCLKTAGALPPKGKANYDFYCRLKKNLQQTKVEGGKEELLLYAIAYGLSYEQLRKIYGIVGGKSWAFYFDRMESSTFREILQQALVGNQKRHS